MPDSNYETTQKDRGAKAGEGYETKQAETASKKAQDAFDRAKFQSLGQAKSAGDIKRSDFPDGFMGTLAYDKAVKNQTKRQSDSLAKASQ